MVALMENRNIPKHRKWTSLITNVKTEFRAERKTEFSDGFLNVNYWFRPDVQKSREKKEVFH